MKCNYRGFKIRVLMYKRVYLYEGDKKIIPYIFSISSYAATKYTYYQGLKLTKMYMPEEEYWVVGISDWKTKEIKMPDKADDNKLITGIYDTSSSRGVFQGNIWLEKIDLSDSNIKVIGSYCFNNCTHFGT